MKYKKMWVEGNPKTKGSWIPIQTKSGIKFRPATKGASKWYKDVKTAVAMQWSAPLIEEGAVSVELLFLLPRPKTVKRKYPTSRFDGDGDKLVRAIFDSMTGIVYTDDSQVVDHIAKKRYADDCEPGVWITVSTDL